MTGDKVARWPGGQVTGELRDPMKRTPPEATGLTDPGRLTGSTSATKATGLTRGATRTRLSVLFLAGVAVIAMFAAACSGESGSDSRRGSTQEVSGNGSKKAS